MGVPNKYWAGTPNYTSGNQGRLYLFPHWTEGGFAGSVATLQNPNRQASAHYVIEGTKVAQLVSEKDTAWHCGNWWYNCRSIGYELVGWTGNPPSYETLDTCARMMAQASKDYFGGAKLVHGKNVILHREVSDTSCPGTTDIAWLIAKANEYLGQGGSTPVPDPSPTPSSQAHILYEVHTADGWLGAVSKVSDDIDGYAGWRSKPIDGIRARRDDGKKIRIRAHILGGGWLEWTTFTNSLWGSNSAGDGYCGWFGHAIDAIQVEGASIRVADYGGYYTWLTGGKTAEGDDYAGVYGRAITKVQMKA